MKNKNQLYEVEIKSKPLIDAGQKGMVTYFQGGTHEQIIANLRQLYPQYMAPEHKPNVNITPITKKEYNKRKKENVVYQRQQLVSERGHVI